MTPSVFDNIFISLRAHVERHPYLQSDIDKYVSFAGNIVVKSTYIHSSGILAAMAVASSEGMVAINTNINGILTPNEMRSLITLDRKLSDALCGSDRERDAISAIIEQMI